MNEVRSIAAYPGYGVSQDGFVWSCRTTSGKIGARWHRLKPGKDRYGHCYVCLYVNGKRKWPFVHVLVLEAFVGPRPAGMEACHFPDRNTENNRSDNLRWDTPLSNSGDKAIHGTVLRGEKAPGAKMTEKIVQSIRALRKRGFTFRQIGTDLGVSAQQAHKVCSGQIWSHVPLEIIREA